MDFKNSLSENEYNRLIEKLSHRQKELERRVTKDDALEILREMGLSELLNEDDIKEVREEVNRDFKKQQPRNYFNFALALIAIVTPLATFGGYRLAAYLIANVPPETAANFPEIFAINVNPEIITDIKVQTGELERQLENEKEESQEKDEAINKLQEELTALENQLEAERKKISKKDEDINKLQQEITSLQEELTALKNTPLEEVPNIPKETTPANSPRARANLKPDQESYTDLDKISVSFSFEFENMDDPDGYIIQLVPSNTPLNYNYRPKIEVGKSDNNVQFGRQTAGNYEIRAFINTGAEWKPIEIKPIEVTKVPVYRAE